MSLNDKPDAVTITKMKQSTNFSSKHIRTDTTEVNVYDSNNCDAVTVGDGLERFKCRLANTDNGPEIDTGTQARKKRELG